MKDDLVLGKAVKKLQRQMQAMKALAPQISMPGNKLVISSTLNPAKWTYERLAKYIQEFESSLDDNHEIGARLVSFGTKIVFHIENIGYHGPDIITFYGIDDSGQNVQLIQNISQLSVLLVAVKKTGKEPRRIGFSLLRDEPEEESETVAVGTPVTRRPPRTDPGV
ncbi:MAG: hypothetical protein KAX13_03775, partial [Candidatus Krumholzibacteria bacterium]|nr:hypothetical protein [Candidatus Krumholzibacteria bacterium]